MNTKIILIILFMALVTYVPRMLPAVIVDKLNFPPKFKKFLSLIPYTAMAALVMPGVVLINPDRLYIGFIGTLVALIFAWLKSPILLSVVAAIAANMLLYQFII